jgi:membrane protein
VIVQSAAHHTHSNPARGTGIGQVAKDIATLARDASARWLDDACYRLGASLAFYAIFSIFPLLLLSVTAVGFFLGGDDAARQRLVDSVAIPRPELRAVLDQTLESMQKHSTARGVGAVVGFLTLFMGASAAFSELESSLNLIWRVEDKAKKGLWDTIVRAVKSKALSFAVVIGAAIAILASLAFGTALQAIGNASAGEAAGRTVWWLIEVGSSFVFLTALFAAIYRIVPQTDVEWRDAIAGAVVASLLFTGLKWSLAWYLAHVASYAAYGAVGGVLGLMTWIYVASLIILYGAEFSRVYTERFGNISRGSPRPSVASPVHPPVGDGTLDRR